MIDNHQKDTSVWIVCYCRTKVADESQLQSDVLLFTARVYFPQVLHWAVLCGEAVIDPTGRDLFIKTHISNMYYKVTEEKGKIKSEVSVQTDFLLSKTCISFSCFTTAALLTFELQACLLLHANGLTLKLWFTFPLTLTNTEYIEGVYQIQPTETSVACCFCMYHKCTHIPIISILWSLHIHAETTQR